MSREIRFIEKKIEDIEKSMMNGNELENNQLGLLRALAGNASRATGTELINLRFFLNRLYGEEWLGYEKETT